MPPPQPTCARRVQRGRLRALGPARRRPPWEGVTTCHSGHRSAHWVTSRRVRQIFLLSQPVVGPGSPREQGTPVVFTCTCSLSLFTSASCAAGPSPRPPFPRPSREEPRDSSRSGGGGGRFASEEPSPSRPATPHSSGRSSRWCRRVRPGEEVAARSQSRPAPPRPLRVLPAPRVTRGLRRRSAERAPRARGRAEARARARAAPMRHARGGAVPRPR